MTISNNAVSEGIVIDVTRDNFEESWPLLQQLTTTSTFVAIDIELTGLGSREGLKTQSLDERYKAFSETAKSRAIVSLGLSFFTCKDKEDQALVYDVRTFNIYVLCEEGYIVEPNSLRFLSENGFDFNKQIGKGILYYPGADRVKEDRSLPSVRGLFQQIARGGATVVMHNGFIDLVFAYQHLYAPLPSNLQTLISDLVSLFPQGVVDTKYIADYYHYEKASYLEFLFRKRLRENRHKEATSQQWVKLYFGNSLDEGAPPPSTGCERQRRTRGDLTEMVCESYAFHGHCPNQSSCTKSHDLDLILDLHESLATKKRRKRKGKNVTSETTNKKEGEEYELKNGMDEMATNRIEGNGEGGVERANQGAGIDTRASAVAMDARFSHRAGFDAFMTGFVFAMDRMEIPQDTMASLVNCLHLSYKQFPLKLIKSQYATTSREHDLKSCSTRDKC